MSSLPKVYVMINNVFGGEGGGGAILAVDINIINNWPPTMLNIYAFYKKSAHIFSMIEVKTSYFIF
jgi:hypothetical protein